MLVYCVCLLPCLVRSRPARSRLCALLLAPVCLLCLLTLCVCLPVPFWCARGCACARAASQERRAKRNDEATTSEALNIRGPAGRGERRRGARARARQEVAIPIAIRAHALFKHFIEFSHLVPYFLFRGPKTFVSATGAQSAIRTDLELERRKQKQSHLYLMH